MWYAMTALPIPPRRTQNSPLSDGDYLLRSMFLMPDGSDLIGEAQIEARSDLDATFGSVWEERDKQRRKIIRHRRKPRPPEFYQNCLVTSQAFYRFEDSVGTDDYPVDCVEALVLALSPVVFSICKRTRGQATEDDYLEALASVVQGMRLRWEKGKTYVDLWEFHDQKNNIISFPDQADEPSIASRPFYSPIFPGSHEIDPLVQNVRDWVRERLRALNERDKVAEDENLPTEVQLSVLEKFDDEADGPAWEAMAASGFGEDTCTSVDRVVVELVEAAESLGDPDRAVAMLLIANPGKPPLKAVAEMFSVEERQAYNYIANAKKNLELRYFSLQES